MKIDSSILELYFSRDFSCQNHWLFDSIQEGKHLFEAPEAEQTESIQELFVSITSALSAFVPYNADLFSLLYPGWEEKLKAVFVLLAVGCPKPYDAMTIEHKGTEYLVFDLGNILCYQSRGIDPISVLQKLITHEFSHRCLHEKYPDTSQPYVDALFYTTFDEGFAHYLAFTENVQNYDFSPMIQVHYAPALQRLRTAYEESNAQKQQELLHASNCGPYWEKFAAVCGQLYLASHPNQLLGIYRAGPTAMKDAILSASLSTHSDFSTFY